MPKTESTVEPVHPDELREPIALPEVYDWVCALCARYHVKPSDPWPRYYSEKRGLTKYLQDELIPLAVLCKRIAENHADSRLQYFPDKNQSFDAKILSPEGNVREVIEVTLACDGKLDSLVAQSTLNHGFAPLYSPIDYSGRLRDRVIPKPEIVSLDGNLIVEECLAQVRNAVVKKSNPTKYTGVNLVVAFDDFRLGAFTHFHDSARQEFQLIKSPFEVIYFVGLGGHFFLRLKNEA